MALTIIIGLGLLLLIGGVVGALYNKLVLMSQRVKNAFAQIDVQLRRRYDLIPSLVEAARAYMSHERDTLTSVIQARNQAVSARDAAAKNITNGPAIGALVSAEAGLAGALTKFFALTENYPDLHANQTIATLMEELSSTENKIGFSRQAFNDAVARYNVEVQSFPTNILASSLGFEEVSFLEAISNEQQRETPKMTLQ